MPKQTYLININAKLMPEIKGVNEESTLKGVEDQLEGLLIFLQRTLDFISAIVHLLILNTFSI